MAGTGAAVGRAEGCGEGGVRAASEPIKRRLRGAEPGRAGLGEAEAIVPGLGAAVAMREIVHIQAGQCGNQIGTKVSRGGVRGQTGLPPLLLREPRLRGALLGIKGVGKRLEPTFYAFI